VANHHELYEAGALSPAQQREERGCREVWHALGLAGMGQRLRYSTVNWCYLLVSMSIIVGVCSEWHAR
jgi:hypothetical protein